MLGVGTVSNGRKFGLPCATCWEDPLKEDRTECHCLNMMLGDQGHVVCRLAWQKESQRLCSWPDLGSGQLFFLLAISLGTLLSFGSLICKVGITEPQLQGSLCI